jgi:DNA-binding transcriptional LysR family regulator
MMDFRKLEIFFVVTEEGSFSAAAERLYLTQSAVSQHIKELEAALGTSLFKRGRRGVQCTAAGEILRGYTQRILRLLAEAEAAVTDVSQISGGQIRIGATPGIGTYVLPAWMQTFRRLYLHLTLSLVTDTTSGIAQRVRQQQLEIGFIEGELEETPPIQQFVLQTVEQVVVVGQQHPCYLRQHISIRDLHQQPMVMRPVGTYTRRWLEAIFRQHQVIPHVAAELDSPAAIKQAVIAGMGITILPRFDVQRELEMGLVNAVTVTDAVMERDLKLIWNSDHPFNPTTRAFLLFLSDQYPHLKELFEFSNASA